MNFYENNKVLNKYLGEAQLKYKSMLGGQTANSGGYKIDIFKRGFDYAFEIWKGSKRVAKGKGLDQFDIKTQAEKALRNLKKL